MSSSSSPKEWLVWPAQDDRPDPDKEELYLHLDPDDAVLSFLEDNEQLYDEETFFAENTKDPNEIYEVCAEKIWQVSFRKRIKLVNNNQGGAA